MNIKKKLVWFNNMDKRLYGEQFDTSADPYFATFSLAFTALLGACATLSVMFDCDVLNLPPKFTIAVSCAMALMNIGESFLDSRNWKVAVQRSFVVTFAVLLSYIIGSVLSVIVVAIVAIWLFLMLITSTLQVAGDSLDKAAREQTETVSDGHGNTLYVTQRLSADRVQVGESIMHRMPDGSYREV